MLVAVLCFLDLLEASVLVLLFDDPVIGVTMILAWKRLLTLTLNLTILVICLKF